MLNDLFYDVTFLKFVGEWSGTKRKGKSLVHPWVIHQVSHVDPFTGIGTEESVKKVLAV